jgi:hypothetical protein
MQHIDLWQHMATHESIKLPLAKVSPTWLQLYYHHPLMWPPMSIASKQVRARLGLAAKGLPTCQATRAVRELDQKLLENSQEIGVFAREKLPKSLPSDPFETHSIQAGNGKSLIYS